MDAALSMEHDEQELVVEMLNKAIEIITSDQGELVVDDLNPEVLAPQAVSLLDMIENIGVIAGGYARFIMLGEPEPSDIDVFAIYEEGIHLGVFKGYQESYHSPYSVTLNHYDPTYLPLQVVKPRRVGEVRQTFGQPDELLTGFDFNVTQFAVWKEDGGYYTCQPSDPNSARPGATLALVGNQFDDPVYMAYHASKYAAKGYHVPSSLYVKLFEYFDGLSPEDKKSALSFGGY